MAYELIKVSELPELTTPSDPNVIPIQDGDYLKRISFENLKEAATGGVADDLAAEVTARESAVSGEATARGNADTAILADLASPYSASSTYAVGDYCTKDGQLYRCTTAITTAEAWTSGHWSAVALGDDTSDLRSALTSETEAREAADEALEESVAEILTDYAQKDGTYEDLTSGNAEQLLSDVYTDNSEPYLFRKTGGSNKVGSREYLDKIVGGSLMWNQLGKEMNATNWSAEANVTLTFADGIATFQSSAYSYGIKEQTGVNAVEGHKYLALANAKANESGVRLVFMYGSVGSSSIAIDAPTSFSVCGGVFPGRTGASGQSTYIFATVNKEVSVKWFMLIDLTSELGSTIADYVYSLETATAGAGVAWLRQYIDIDSYHPYSKPTLKHVEGLVSHDTVGFNQFDKSIAIDGKRIKSDTGIEQTNATWARSDYIRVLPNTIYYTNADGTNQDYTVTLYDAEKNYIGYRPVTSAQTFNTGDASYIILSTIKSIVSIDDLVLNLSWSGYRNGEYEPYQKHSYPLDSSVVLRGYPMLVDDKLKYDGDEYLPDGKINRKYVDLVFDGSADEAWSLQSINAAGIANFYITIPDYSVPITVICNNADFPLQNTTIANTTSQGFLLSGSYTLYIRILSTTASSVEALKTWLASNNLEFVYKAYKSTTEQAEPFRQLQICDTYGTEEFVTTSEVPVGTETRYPEDLTAKIEGLPWNLSMIAPIEDGATASQAYTTGQYFLRNNVFCKALTNIASRATFTLNTNYTETTVAAELYTALH